MDTNILKRILKRCSKGCYLKDLYDLAPKSKIINAIDKLIGEEQLIEVTTDDKSKPRYQTSALGRITLKNKWLLDLGLF